MRTLAHFEQMERWYGQKKKPPHLSNSHVIIINNDPLAVRLYCPTIETASNRLSKSVSADGRSTEQRTERERMAESRE